MSSGHVVGLTDSSRLARPIEDLEANDEGRKQEIGSAVALLIADTGTTRAKVRANEKSKQNEL